MIAHENGELTEVARFAWPLPWAKDAAMAEAYGARMAMKILKEYVVKLEAEAYTKIIQGDNISVIGYWQGTRNVRKVNMYCIHQRPIGEWKDTGCEIADKFEFIYRSYNKAADAAADVGARMVEEYEPEEDVPKFYPSVREGGGQIEVIEGAEPVAACTPHCNSMSLEHPSL